MTGTLLDDAPARALAGAAPVPFWLDDVDRPAARGRLDGDLACDLAIVGGGYSGLWTALRAKERDPGRDVVLLEADRIGGAASGRNGGFCEASLTHGEANGRRRWPDEADRLEELGLTNLDEIEATLQRYGIDCDFRRTGQLAVATEAHQVEELRAEADGTTTVFLDEAAVRAEVASPTYLAGLWSKDTCATVDPARLAWGLAETAERLGVRIVEGTAVRRIRRSGGQVAVETAHGTVRAHQVALGTNAHRPLLRRLRLATVPVYDYVLMTEPLSDAQLASVGWAHRQGLADCGNQFHYYRLTADNRILWGGYDAIYHFGRKVRATYDQRPATFEVLAQHFFTTFPQLAGIRFTHRWGGAIDTCTRFCAFFGTAYGGRVAYALGYTGLGVGATRFGADVMLDLLAGEDTERTRLALVRRRPLPFPPEPVAWIGIQVTRWSLARADARGGRRNLWLRLLDRLGLGFDS
ncbi:glycine/D-amino acid oxidase-like deaminating enzyme [Nocardioides aromaticivorans]|uniref:Glycine/D-amino acid oxidase-like deaminating enzyme n=1 Tax=Nocardioides aromaticivorans TaxID=200618 RepID=A0A7Y9ZKS0_9ACTN|nr:FAD-dependent oxidoreductase [Nocardioides aromaticivorans]NYI45715.1 glycine/D-amino acid oxidase-like deaminating enzyme [Nocardioides aromaticivorans]